MPTPQQYILPDHWLTDAHLDQLANDGFCIVDDACSSDLLNALQHESQLIHAEFQQAKISVGGLNQHIRSDKTRWLSLEDPAGRPYLELLEQLGQQLNRHLYTGIRRVEAHYATYEAGDYYQAHRDNPAHSQARAISSVFYINCEWQADWQGQLRLQDNTNVWHDILPMPNRLVLFQSDLLHEVCAATCTRRSIAGWLRRDDA
jgi:SM-20-related protein